jgi:hypothetical protein
MSDRMFEVRLIYKLGKGKEDEVYGVFSASSKEEVKERCLSRYPKCRIIEIKDVEDEEERGWQSRDKSKKKEEKKAKKEKEDKIKIREEDKKMGKCKKGKKGK